MRIGRKAETSGLSTSDGQKQIRNVSTGTDTAGSLAIGGGKVYWTEMTGESGGTVNSANLNGTGATQLASILCDTDGNCC